MSNNTIHRTSVCLSPDVDRALRKLQRSGAYRPKGLPGAQASYSAVLRGVLRDHFGLSHPKGITPTSK